MTEVEGKRRANLHEWLKRFQRLLFRGLTTRAAETVVDAAMFGHGCTEGTVRATIQAAFEKSVARNKDLLGRLNDDPVHISSRSAQ